MYIILAAASIRCTVRQPEISFAAEHDNHTGADCCGRAIHACGRRGRPWCCSFQGSTGILPRCGNAETERVRNRPAISSACSWFRVWDIRWERTEWRTSTSTVSGIWNGEKPGKLSTNW